MNFDSLFSDVSYRVEKGDLRVAKHLEITKVITSPKEADGHALFVMLRTPLHDGRRFAKLAYERGCRLFL